MKQLLGYAVIIPSVALLSTRYWTYLKAVSGLAQTPKRLNSLTNLIEPPHVSIASVKRVCIGNEHLLLMVKNSKHTQKNLRMVRICEAFLLAFFDSGFVSNETALQMSGSRSLINLLMSVLSILCGARESFWIKSLIVVWHLAFRVRHTWDNWSLVSCWLLKQHWGHGKCPHHSGIVLCLSSSRSICKPCDVLACLIAHS